MKVYMTLQEGEERKYVNVLGLYHMAMGHIAKVDQMLEGQGDKIEAVGENIETVIEFVQDVEHHFQ